MMDEFVFPTGRPLAEVENVARQMLNATLNITVRGCLPGEVNNAAGDECNVCL
jgi:hypothetical protein